jgi:hypothetical protein
MKVIAMTRALKIKTFLRAFFSEDKLALEGIWISLIAILLGGGTIISYDGLASEVISIFLRAFLLGGGAIPSDDGLALTSISFSESLATHHTLSNLLSSTLKIKQVRRPIVTNLLPVATMSLGLSLMCRTHPTRSLKWA